MDDSKVSLAVKDTHAVLMVPAGMAADVRASLGEIRPTVRIMSVGEAIEIYKSRAATICCRAIFRYHG